MRKRFSPESGFTLIEVIVVILLLGIAVALVVPRGLRQASVGAALDTEAQKMAGTVRLARQKAMDSGLSYKVYFATDKYYLVRVNQDLSETAEPAQEVDGNAKIENAPGGRCITFFPAGTAAPEETVIVLAGTGDSTGKKTLTVNSRGIVDIRE